MLVSVFHSALHSDLLAVWLKVTSTGKFIWGTFSCQHCHNTSQNDLLSFLIGYDADIDKASFQGDEARPLTSSNVMNSLKINIKQYIFLLCWGFYWLSLLRNLSCVTFYDGISRIKFLTLLLMTWKSQCSTKYFVSTDILQAVTEYRLSNSALQVTRRRTKKRVSCLGLHFLFAIYVYAL
jgi:hypothetical protein